MDLNNQLREQCSEGVGFTSHDFTIPHVGIASTWSKVTPCNMHINKLASIVEDSINDQDCKEYCLTQLLFPMVFQWEPRE
ncbi:MAG: hypothetical protein CM15mP127_05610 [Gammaproteobacteria bacterium]|nr:MAG: hypothetical protein CM15mP127_05610 [Gammaproteobacteria bacterium]